MKKEFMMVLLLLFIGITAAYGQTITTTITGSGDFPGGTKVNVSPTAGSAIGVESTNSNTTINFLGSSVITVTQTGGSTGNSSYCVDNSGGSINFAGFANMTLEATESSLESCYGLYNRRGGQISFDSGLDLKVTNAGDGSSIGIYLGGRYSGRECYITVAGAADITVENIKNSIMVMGIFFGGISSISFDSDLNLKVTNAGTTAAITAGLHVGGSPLTVAGAANITIDVTNEENDGNVYGVYIYSGGEVSFGASSSVTIYSSGTGAVYGVYIAN